MIAPLIEMPAPKLIYEGAMSARGRTMWSRSRHHRREIQRSVFVATDAERWCRDGPVGVVVDPA
jgi:hypothetical protein